MRIRATLAGTAVLVTLLGTGALPAGPWIKSAVAQSEVSINVFYDSLGQYGDWVRYRDRYVFVPTKVEAAWRPYTLGHWVHADRFGWTWVSDEPFGWATYHYGRWGYAEEIGWYWVPGTVWAPAWVSWKRTPEYVVWAPLPVTDRYDYDDADVQIDVSVGDIPDRYWVVVPAPQFLEINLDVVILKDRDRRRRIVETAEPIGTVVVENNIVVNNVINVSFVQERTGRRVRTVEVREVEDPRNAKSTDDVVVAVPDRIRIEKNAKPQKVSDVERVKKDRGAQEKSGVSKSDEPGNAVVDEGDVEPGATSKEPESAAGTAEDQDGATVPRKKEAAGQAEQTPSTTQGAVDEADQGGKGKVSDETTGQKGKRKQRKAQDQQLEAVPPEGSQGVIDQQDQATQGKKADRKKPKRKQQSDQQSGAQGAAEQEDAKQSGSGDQGTGQKAKRKKNEKQQDRMQGAASHDEQPSTEPQGQKAKRKKPTLPEGTQGMMDPQDQGASSSVGSAGGSQSQGQGGEPGQASGGQTTTEELLP